MKLFANHLGKGNTASAKPACCYDPFSLSAQSSGKVKTGTQKGTVNSGLARMVS